ncbi:MAG: PadR family transcriptional regulator [Magnetovibrionaceae bacterium]
MDAQTLCLGALMMGDASGYEIRKAYEEGPLSFFHDVNYGSIYPALAKLSEKGLVTFDLVREDGRPERKVYAITDAGRVVFRDRLSQVPARERLRSEHVFMLFFGHELALSHLHSVVDDLAKSYQAVIDRIEEANENCADVEGPRRFVRGLGDALYSAGLRYIETHKNLLQEGLPEGAKAGADLKTGTR